VAVAALALVALVALHAPSATAKNGAYGDYVRAADLLRDWRYDEARERIAELEKRWPKTAETRYLKAEMAFLDGTYPAALEFIDDMKDSEVDGHVGKLRALVASTQAVTSAHTKIVSSGGHFEIFYPPGKDEVIAELAGEVLEHAYRELGSDLEYHPAEKVRVEFLARPADLAQLSTLTEAEIETSGTIALCKYNKLMVVTPRATWFGYPWMDTLTHEYAHYVISRASHDEVPVWLHEGLARFEQERWRSPTSSGLSPSDTHLLATALRHKQLIPFKKMHPSMALLPSQEAVALAFAEVHTMVTYLHGRVGYPGLRRIIVKLREGKSANRAVAEVLDTRWPKVEKGWKSYLRAANLKPSKTIGGHARAPRIRFRKGGEDSENIGVDAIASQAARKHTRLGGLLRSRGMSEAAAIEYEKALAVGADDDPFVVGKLSRTYLELQRYERAIELAELALAANEHNAAAASTLGQAHFALGSFADAGAAFEAALRVSPFDPTVRCSLAEIYSQRQETELAAREQRACQLLRP
jgi:tetratricopeptide (TPR) repeat protein